jgi:SAM-dependent methyltransferase
MNVLPRIEGMKFPDEMVTRFFFKYGLDKSPGTVLELGCGNGNNLALFAAYGWQCLGVDIDDALIGQGRRNFASQGFENSGLLTGDLNRMLPDVGAVDALLMPSSIYYLPESRAREIVALLAPHARGAQVFCRFRARDDYRYGKGEAVATDCFRLTIDETSEQGCLVVFYDEDRFLNLLSPLALEPESVKILHLIFDNLGKGGRLIRNHDVVIWGRAAPLPAPGQG